MRLLSCYMSTTLVFIAVASIGVASAADPASDESHEGFKKTQLTKPAPAQRSGQVTGRRSLHIARQTPLIAPSTAQATIISKPTPTQRSGQTPLRRSSIIPLAAPLDVPPAARAPDRATLIFTATDLKKDYRGGNLGTGSLRLYTPGGQCEYPPKSLAQTQDVTADRPSVSLNVPADQPLVLASFWTSGPAHCVVGNYQFVPKKGRVYKLTNTQNRSTGVCRLELQRLDDRSNRYVNDYSMRSTRGTCDHQVALGH